MSGPGNRPVFVRRIGTLRRSLGMGKVQGEGDYEPAKKFDDDEGAFVKSGRVDKGARGGARGGAKVAGRSRRNEKGRGNREEPVQGRRCIGKEAWVAHQRQAC